MENFINFGNFFSFTEITVIPAILMLIIGGISTFYNNIFTGNHFRTSIMLLATLCSIFAIFSVNYVLTFVAMESLAGLCFLLVLLSKKLKRRLAISYFLIHAFAGVLMIVAIIMNFIETKGFEITKATSLFSLKEVIMLFSLAINVAVFPFTKWYFKTYQQTDSFSLIFLSAITTKTSFFILWKIIPGSKVLFEIGFITLIFAMVFALITKNIIKFLLLTSIASMGFTIMSISYKGFLIAEGILSVINYQLVWYISSSVFAICGFLTLYGFITNNECKDNSFHSIQNYFQEAGSSIHFVIPAIIFGLCLASFPLTASFIAKTNITKFFVEDKLVYYTFKATGVIFIMFAIKLIMPVCYSVEFFKLDSKGKKLATILYLFVGFLMLINIIFLQISKTKINLFTISVEFFIFIAYTLLAGVLLFMLEFSLKALHIKKMVEIIAGDYIFLRRFILLFAHKIKARYHIIIEAFHFKKKKAHLLLPLSKVSPFASLLFVISFLLTLLINI